MQGQLEHPAIVPVHDLGERDGGELYFSMKCVRGVTLAEAMKAVRSGDQLARFSRRRLLTSFSSVCLAIDFAHARGVVHRDLKPGNLLRTRDGFVKIADFGIARAVEETRVTQIGTVLGTLRYLAPEQAEGRDVGPQADVFSLGVVLDELLTEKRRSVRRLLERCRARDPRRRPTSADVASLLGAQTQSATAVTVVRHARRRRSAPLLAVVALAAALAILVGVLVAQHSPSRPAPTPVTPVARSTDASRQAQNLIRWVRRYSAP